MDCDLIEKNIEAYLDGELTLSDRRDFEEHVSACKTCTGKLESLRTLQAIVRKADYANVPSSLKNNIHNQLRDYTGEDSKTFSLRNRLGLGASAIAAGSLATWAIMTFMLTAPLQFELADEIISSHVRSLMVDHVTDIKSTDQHTVKPWFNGRVDFSPPVHDLSAAGFELIGGRLDYIRDKAVSALVYRRRAHLINTFIFKSDEDKDPIKLQHMQRQGYNLVRWSANGLAYWVISDLNKQELNEFTYLLTK